MIKCAPYTNMIERQRKRAKEACTRAGVEFIDSTHVRFGTFLVEFRFMSERNIACYHDDQSVDRIANAIEERKGQSIGEINRKEAP